MLEKNKAKLPLIKLQNGNFMPSITQNAQQKGKEQEKSRKNFLTGLRKHQQEYRSQDITVEKLQKQIQETGLDKETFENSKKKNTKNYKNKSINE